MIYVLHRTFNSKVEDYVVNLIIAICSVLSKILIKGFPFLLWQGQKDNLFDYKKKDIAGYQKTFLILISTEIVKLGEILKFAFLGDF